MRGKAGKAWQENNQSRITPAYAGKRQMIEICICSRWDHPRLCGEKINLIPNALNGAGSPPPMRGKVLNSEVSLRCYGITPAYAGKSFIVSFAPFTFQDHPRLCGEKQRLEIVT